MKRLDNWIIVSNNIDSPYLAPELREYSLVGNLNGGKRIKTSAIRSRIGRSIIVTKSGTRYQLGKPDVEYELVFPDCKERLFNQLEEIKINKETLKRCLKVLGEDGE